MGSLALRAYQERQELLAADRQGLQASVVQQARPEFLVQREDRETTSLVLRALQTWR